jgi:hypothetical protein
MVSLWPFDPSTIMLVASKPVEKGVLLHLREVSGKVVTLKLNNRSHAWRIEETDPLGMAGKSITELEFQPYGVRFVRLSH